MFRKYGDEVARVEAVADLVPVTAETDVFKWALAEVGVEPIGKNSLVGAAELTGTREHAAAVDKDRKVKRRAVFEREGFAGKFSGAVERDRGGSRKLFGDAGRADTARMRGADGGAKSVLVDLNVEGGEGRDRVDPASGKKDEAGSMGFAELEHVHRAAKIVLDELAGTGFAVDSGKDARVGGGVDDPIDAGKGFEIAGRTKIAVEKFDAEFLQRVAIGLAAGADEIIEAEECVARAGLSQGSGEGAADKAAHTGD